MSTTPGSPVCLNCGAVLSGRFCAACGQEVQPLNPTVGHVAHEFIHEMLHLDGRIFRSFQTLLLSPGALTLEYLEGRRARWIAPIRLYLVFSLVYFAVASVSTPQVNVVADLEGDAGVQRLGFENAAELRDAVSHELATWTPRAMFVLVPLFALLVRIAYRRAGRHYPQHLYFALHVHAAWFALASLGAALRPVPGGDAIGTFLALYALVYFVLALKKVYGTAGGVATRRALAILAAYSVAVVMTIAAIVVPAVLWRR
jgi:hypothetical protein